YELGGDSLRGFVDDGIGPRDIRTGDALGGLYFYKGTIELAFPLGLPPELGIKGALFSDAGSVWHSSDKSPFVRSNNQKIRASVGTGVTWRSPFGPIGVSFAKAVARVKGLDRTEVFRVNFGTNF